ncbi:hypothetical protein SEUCBS139899_005097 [Sporothrix eucalyptigena]|uniref:LPXTG-domain-containing protein n=1 Tax=Sporothrix eucalyptigena TaxID=1812306 RepID=A0ABP0C8W6_9PEZI
MARLHHSDPMATAVFVFIFSLLIVSTLAIQVSPNSPCASLCIDNSSLDTSDPNSSTTTNADISCYDSDFVTSSAGQKWTSCMGCLQNSTFSQGDESDQAWFFYNLRYNVDYCVFGYPNASNVGSNPCQTSTACGPMQGSLLDGIPTMGNQTEYGYCTANGTTLTSTLFKSCVACVSGGGQQNIIANSLTALEAGCLQQLPPSEVVGLSGTVFTSATLISIVAPTETSGSGSSGSGDHRVATTTIAVIVVVALLVLAAVSGFAFVCYRKRRGSARRAVGASRNIFRKDNGLSSAESAVGGGFVPSGGITGSALGGATSSPITQWNSPASATSSGPTAWSARFQSKDHITSPLSFQCRASGTDLDEMVDLKTISTPDIPVVPAVLQSHGKGHSRNNSASSINDLQEQQLQQQVPSASRKKYQKPQAISSAAITAQIQAVIEKNSNNNSSSNGASGLGIGGLSNASSGLLPAIVESPFPSPAPMPGVPDSIGLRIHSSDFDKKDYVEAAVQLQNQQKQKQSQPLSPPRLHQLKTSFSPPMGSNGSTSPSTFSTPTSTTALLASTSLPSQQQQSTTPVYNPAAYSPVSYHPGSLYAQSQRGSIGYQQSYAGHHTNNNSATNSPMREPISASSYTAPTGPSPTVYNAAAAASKRGVYQGWSAMVTAAQQYQQQQLQMQKQQGSTSQPVSAVGSYRERDPISAVSVASMVSVASSNGLGSATMAVRQSFSGNGAGDVSATSSHAPSNAFPPGNASASTGGSAAAVRPVHNKSPHTKSRTSMIARSPHSTRSPQHTTSELVRTDFLPPPAAKIRR